MSRNDISIVEVTDSRLAYERTGLIASQRISDVHIFAEELEVASETRVKRGCRERVHPSASSAVPRIFPIHAKDDAPIIIELTTVHESQQV